MNDQFMMEDVLTTLKNQIDLFSHGTVESSTAGVHNTFRDALCKASQQQNEVYNAMAAMGWYPSTQAEQQQIEQVKQKYSQPC